MKSDDGKGWWWWTTGGVPKRVPSTALMLLRGPSTPRPTPLAERRQAGHRAPWREYLAAREAPGRAWGSSGAQPAFWRQGSTCPPDRRHPGAAGPALRLAAVSGPEPGVRVAAPYLTASAASTLLRAVIAGLQQAP